MSYITGFIILILSCVLFLTLRRKKIVKNETIYISLIILYVIIFTLQINQLPFERYPNWDMFWGDARTAGNLISLKHALSNFEVPTISPYINFGWNFAGEPVTISFLSPINLFIMVFSPSDIILFRTIIFLILGGIGAYLFIKLLTNDNFISFFASLAYISIPLVIGMIYYTTALTHYCLIPIFLYLIHKTLETNSIKNIMFFIVLSVFAVSSGDVYFFVILPPVVGLYSFLIAYRYYHRGLLNSFKKALFLVFLSCLSSSFYLIPLYNNLRTISIAETCLREAGFSWPLTSLGVRGFLSFFYKYCLQSLYKPIEGSGLLLYIPAFFYFVIIFSLIFWRLVFKENPKQIVIPFTLVLLGLMMFFISVIFYSIPAISKAGKGVLRYHINLIPFMILLAGFICFASINNLKNKKIKIGIYALIIIFSLVIDLLLFGSPRIANSPHFLFQMSSKNPYVESSNLIHINFLKDSWLLLPWINMLFVVILFSYNFFRKIKGYITKYIVFIIFAMILPLLSISLHNELRLQQAAWQLLSRNPYRWNNYLQRKACIDKMIDRYDINYRTLYAGKGNTDGRSIKLTAETELHVQDREKVLFSYREIIHPYTALMRSTFSKFFQVSNLWPPLSREISNNIDTLKLMGVKWVISTDEEINNPYLIYKGECISEDGPLGRREGGSMYIYELVNPLGIAFLVDNYKKISLIDSLKEIYENKELPWKKNIVYLETDPINEEEQSKRRAADMVFDLESKAEIKRETFNSIEINVSSPKEKYLVLTYLYRPNWKAYINSSEVKVYRAYGGFMCIKILPGKHLVKFKYYPFDVYIGFLITIFTFLLPFTIRKFF